MRELWFERNRSTPISRSYPSVYLLFESGSFTSCHVFVLDVGAFVRKWVRLTPIDMNVRRVNIRLEVNLSLSFSHARIDVRLPSLDQDLLLPSKEMRMLVITCLRRVGHGSHAFVPTQDPTSNFEVDTQNEQRFITPRGYWWFLSSDMDQLEGDPSRIDLAIVQFEWRT